jgi:DNA helicase-2/ATP-dependent DNA helicase PcrA
MISLLGLNPAQRQAAEHLYGPLLILAGAGSGKTRTITYRVAHMIKNAGIPAHEILGVSFTNKAAAEMLERLRHLIPESRPRRGLTLSTFHSLGLKILREDIHHLGYNNLFTIYDTSDQMSLIREGLKVFKAQKSFDKSMIQSKLSWLKNKGIAPEEFANSPFYDPENPYDVALESLYPFYQEKLRFYNALDFDDILFLVVKLFSAYPEVAKKYSERYRFIMVDEYQDTNGLQFQLIQGLTSQHHNICVVGDDDQAIYSFRGADIENILSFEKQFKGSKVVKLEENYRSTRPILDLANAVIKQNVKRKDKTMFTQTLEGKRPELWAAGNGDHEAQVVVDDIIHLQQKGVPLGEIAVLYRSNTQIPIFEDQLRLQQVPYRVIGGQKFYEKKEIKDLIAYLAVIMNPHDELNLRRILNTPQRGIGTATLEKMLTQQKNSKSSLFTALKTTGEQLEKTEMTDFHKLLIRYREEFKHHRLSQTLKKLIEDLEYLKFVEESYDSSKLSERKKKDVENFLLSAERFEDKFKDEATLRNFVERLLLIDNQDFQGASGDENNHQVTLMTLHSAKGLEFDYVYLVGMEEEILPHKKTLRQDEDVSEERRLCYVGITRARKKLVMTYAKERELYGRLIARHPSRFMLGLEEYYQSRDKTTFEDMTPDQITAAKDDFFSSLIASLSEN